MLPNHTEAATTVQQSSNVYISQHQYNMASTETGGNVVRHQT